MKGKQIRRESKIEQKRTQKRTEETEKKGFLNCRVKKKEKREERKKSDVQQLSAQSTKFVLGRIPQETILKSRKNRKKRKNISKKKTKNNTKEIKNKNQKTPQKPD